jgi:glycosyltransferase involved in cell wall biosynthesis
MFICQIADSPFGKLDGKLFSPIASVRLRALQIAPELARLNCRVNVVPVETVNDRIREGHFFDADIFVLQKMLHDVSPLLDQIMAANKPIVVDVCDDIASAPHLRDFYPNLLKRADIVTASSETLATRLKEFTGAEIIAIPDSVELQKGHPRAPQGNRLELIWFGRSSNIHPLVEALPGLQELAQETKVSLTIVSDLPDSLLAYIRQQAGKIRVNTEEWSPTTLGTALERADIAILPLSSSASDKAKSSNRLQEALWAGRSVVATENPSNAVFSDSAFLSNDIAKGIRAALEDKDEMLRHIERGQEIIASTSTPKALAPIWQKAFRKATTVRQSKPAGINEIRTRLNLGCGDKPMPGYVNVDIASSRKDRSPDVLNDLRDLNHFKDGSADEIIAIHVIEHFYRWEVDALLKEWCRVLRPGGTLTLECPNIITACEELLRNPALAKNATANGSEAMWPLYGDPSWNDPLMVHRWGYTPDSLSEVMSQAGLVKIRREHAQFKRREPRDMRLTGEKPINA